MKKNKDEKFINKQKSKTVRTLTVTTLILLVSFLIVVGIFAKLVNDAGLKPLIHSAGTGILNNIKYFRPVETILYILANFRKVYLSLGMWILIPFMVAGVFYLVATAILGIYNRYIMNKTTTLHGSARWATREELLENGLLGKFGLVFGQTDKAVYSKHPVELPTISEVGKEKWKELKRSWKPGETTLKLDKKGELITEFTNQHVLVVGSTRSGKGVGTVIPTNFLWPDSMIIFDPKYEAWKICSAHRSKFSYCFKLDPTNPTESIHYNPLLSIRRDSHIIADLQNLGIILIPDDNSKDPFWNSQARRLFVALCGYILYCLPIDQKNFRSLNHIFTPDVKDNLARVSKEDLKDELEKLTRDIIALDNRLKEIPREDKAQRKLVRDKLNELIKRLNTLSNAQQEMLSELASTMESETAKVVFENETEAAEKTKENEQSTIESSAIKRALQLYIKRVHEVKNDPNRKGTPEQYQKFSKRWSLPRNERLEIERECADLLFENDLKALDEIENDLLSFKSTEERELSSVVSTMTSKTIVITDPNVQEITSKSDFVFEDFVEGVPDEDGNMLPMTLYLTAELSEIQRLMPLFRLFYEQSIKILARELDSEKTSDLRVGRPRKYKLLLLFDEFPQMDRMDVVLRALSLSAGYGIICCLIVQSFEQLNVIYQNSALITDNCAFQLVMRTNDMATCKKVEDILAKSTQKHTTIQSSGRMFELAHISESENVNEIGRALMTADEIFTMPDDDCLLIVAGKHPYRAKKVRYFLDSRFKKFYLDSKGHQIPPARLVNNMPHRTEEDRWGYDREGWKSLHGIVLSENNEVGFDKKEVAEDELGIHDYSDAELEEEKIRQQGDNAEGGVVIYDEGYADVPAEAEATGEKQTETVGLDTPGQKQGAMVRAAIGQI